MRDAGSFVVLYDEAEAAADDPDAQVTPPPPPSPLSLGQPLGLWPG
jgi:hypothetical protein